MGNKMIGKAVNQFIQIAGMWALVWGALGGASFRSGPNPAWWCYAAEHLIVWLLCHMLINHFYG